MLSIVGCLIQILVRFDCPFFLYFKESNNNNKNPNDKSNDVNFFTIIQIMTSIIMFLFSLLFCYLTISISLLFHSWSYKQTNNHRHYGNYNNNNNNHRPTTTTFIQKRYTFSKPTTTTNINDNIIFIIDNNNQKKKRMTIRFSENEEEWIPIYQKTKKKPKKKSM